MRLLLDTHTVLWWLGDDPRLPASHRDAVRQSSNQVLVSAITVAELSIKAALDKLVMPEGLLDQLRTEGFGELPFTAAHAEVLRDLPPHHRDPFDRMLIAQVMVEDLTFLTSDERIKRYDISVL